MRLPNSFIAAVVAGGLLIGSNVAASAATYQIERWPADIGKVCDAWKKVLPGGAWQQLQPIEVTTLQAKNKTISGTLFSPTSNEARLLNTKCSNNN